MPKKTSLFEKHQDLKARFVSFAGWQMPLYYKGIHSEVSAVRNTGGLFDVSHMARITIRGDDTLPFLEHLSTNSVIDKPFGKAFYTVFCNEQGGAVDDLLVYLISPKLAFIVVNAANREKDYLHLLSQCKPYSVWIEPHFEDEGILSLQGPNSHEIVRDYAYLKPFEFVWLEGGVFISRTGYTGERGYEFYGPKNTINHLWDRLLKSGSHFGIEPCGLAARDILRLEMGYALYGHELSETIDPLESVARFAVKMDAHEFLGKQAMQSATNLRVPIAIAGMENIPAREGYLILHQGHVIGKVTSGGFSPTLNRPIALGLVERSLPEKAHVDVLIRSSSHPFEIVKLPFIKRSS